MSGLVGWWPLNETEGNTAYDLSGNGNHGSLNGGITQGVAGKAGLHAYSFDGSDDYIQIPHDTSQNPNNGSWSLWFRADSIGNRQDFLDKTNGSNSYHFQINPDVIAMGIHEGGSFDRYYTDYTPNQDIWTHAVVTWRSGEALNFYINGNLVHSASIGNVNLPNSNELTLGTSKGGDSPFDGSLLDFRLYNRVLSASEVRELYRQGSVDLHKKSLSDGSDGGAVSRWKLNDGGADGSTAVDSWNNNDGTINGASFTDNSVRNDGRALLFDGDNDYVDLGASPDFEFSSGQSFTISLWFNHLDFSGSGGQGAIITKGYGTDGEERPWYLSRPREEQAQFMLRDSNGNDFLVQGRTNVSEGWHHQVAIYDASSNELRLFVNGSLENSLSGVSEDSYGSNNSNLELGFHNGEYYNGIVDDVRFFNRALSSWEVFELYRWGSLGKDMRKELVNKKGGGR